MMESVGQNCCERVIAVICTSTVSNKQEDTELQDPVSQMAYPHLDRVHWSGETICHV
jgi:hypothetical protein